MDYEPLPLAAYCNAGAELYHPNNLQFDGTYLQPLPAVPPVGLQSFHGLPFLIGAADEPVANYGKEVLWVKKSLDMSSIVKGKTGSKYLYGKDSR